MIVVPFATMDVVLASRKFELLVTKPDDVVSDSMASRELDCALTRELESTSTGCIVIVCVKVTTVTAADRLVDLLVSENAEKGLPTVVVTVGSADVAKQPMPTGEKSRQKGTLPGQHCGSGTKLFVQLGDA